MDSECYLSGEKDSSATRNTGYKCILKKEFTVSSIFQLKSFYKSKKQGDEINITDSVTFKNTNNNCYLNFDSKCQTVSNYPFYDQIEDDLRPDCNYVDAYCSVYPSYYSNEPTVAWSFERFVEKESYIGSAKLSSPIRGQDLIYINHPELRSDLTSDGIYQGKLPEVYFRKYGGTTATETNSLNSIWQIEHLSSNDQGAIFESIEHNEEVLTSNLTTNHFRLRHFLTGRLLVYQTLPEHIEDFQPQIVLKRNVPHVQFEEFRLSKPTKSEMSDYSIGGLQDSPSTDKEKGLEYQKFNFEFVITDEQYVRNKCLVYLQSKGLYMTTERLNIQL